MQNLEGLEKHLVHLSVAPLTGRLLLRRRDRKTGGDSAFTIESVGALLADNASLHLGIAGGSTPKIALWGIEF